MAGPEQPCQADELPRHHRERDGLEMVEPDATEFQERLRRRARRAHEDVGEWPADYPLDERAGRGRGDLADGDEAAVAHDGYLVGDPEDLVDAMRHVDHSDTAIAERTEGVEEPLDIGRRQTRRRLIQHEEIDVHR